MMQTRCFYRSRHFLGEATTTAILTLGLLFCTSLAALPRTYGQTRSLEEALRPLIAAHRGDVSVAVKNLMTGEAYSHRGEEPMPTASLIKFPVMIAAYDAMAKGDLNADDVVTLQQQDKVPGSGILTRHFSADAPLLVRDAIRLMIAYSDNTATNLVVDRIGIKTTADLMTTLGCCETKLHSKVYRRDTSVLPERSKRFGLGSTTAQEMVELLEKLYQKELVSKAASEAMMQHLLACEDNDKIARLLPPGTKYAHKTGSVSAIRTDAGILFGPEQTPVAICVLTNENQDQSWSQTNEAEILCAKIGRATYDHFFAPPTDRADDPQQPLAIGSAGPMVEALQRTLNARLAPSPGLGVDGDFGPITQSAVERFQKSNGLAVTGDVDSQTWAALGPLVDEDPQAPSPETINNRQLAKQPAEALSGPPLVTCRAWAIGDAETGELLWSEGADEVVDIASTTKMMTAYLVLKLAQDDPSVLDETLTFSERAADVPGSTSSLRAGEQLPVRELLFGLLLPSGNDASVALAEHFGDRLADEAADAATAEPTAEAYERFIAAMNRAAKELGMASSQFANPHGLTAEGHRGSAADLLALAHRAYQIPLFREIVATRERGCTVTGAGGYQRNVHWTNTNRLLGIEGYGGIKTGTTRAAGACLVSQARRGQRTLLAVVLGASSSDARYTDTRNLYRWAWNQLPEQAPKQATAAAHD